MLTGQYYPGCSITLSAQFSLATTGDLVDPTTVTCTIETPSGVNDTPTPIRTTTGTYYVEYSPQGSGTYVHRWVGSGNNPQVMEAEFFVQPSGVR